MKRETLVRINAAVAVQDSKTHPWDLLADASAAITRAACSVDDSSDKEILRAIAKLVRYLESDQ